MTRPVNATDFLKIPLVQLQQPQNHYVCLLDHWWEVTPDDCVLIYTKRGCFSPQCNTVKSIVERLGHDGCRAMFVPIAYLPPRYYQDR